MNILKKIVGIVLLLLAGLFSLATLLNFIRSVAKIINKNDAYTSYEMGYTIGTFVGILIVLVLIFFMAKFGLKLISNKKEQLESVDEIGNSN